MTREEAIHWARQAGIKLPNGPFPERGSFSVPELADFALRVYAAGAAAEREAVVTQAIEQGFISESYAEQFRAAIRLQQVRGEMSIEFINGSTTVGRMSCEMPHFAAGQMLTVDGIEASMGLEF
jgi:hypothetical protein